MSSAQRKKDILEKVESAKGYKVFKVKPSEITQKDINYMVNVINKRLYNIEKKGYTEQSREYRSIEQYANEGSPFYTKRKDGTIRVRSSLKSFKGREREKYINVLRNIMLSKTSTVSGTKKASKTAYDTFIEKYGFDKNVMTLNKYGKIWQLYKEKVRADARDKFGSDKVISMVEYGGFAELTPDEMESVFDYMANTEYDLDRYDEWLNMHKQSN